MKNLVIYYSRDGQNYVSGSIKDLSVGQTEKLVKQINNVDYFKVETIVPYSEDYRECTREAQRDIDENIKPKLMKYLDNIDEYDNIILAGPCWWGTYPMAMFSLLDSLNLNNNNTYVIMTHEGSGLGHVINDLSHYNINIKNALAIRGSNVENSQEEINNLLKEIM